MKPKNESHIYLDYAATTPIDERVVEAMAPYYNQKFGNTSSIHYYGQEAANALENARENVASILNCNTNEIIFTSCGSESDNLALRGVAFATREKRRANHILISPVEHHAVTKTALQLARLHQFEVEFLPVNQYGQVDPEDVEKRLRSDTAIVSIIYANNEIGSINPIPQIGEVCQQHGIPFHTDAVQATAYLPIDLQAMNVDLLSIGAHKFYGPKGIGVLYIKDGTPIYPILTGGGQEFGLRAGTHNMPYIIGLSKALQIANDEKKNFVKRIVPLRNQIIKRVLTDIPRAFLSGHPTQRLPNHASFVFDGVDGNELLIMLDVAGFACSSGSACKTGAPEPSNVLLAIGTPPERALGSLRVTLGHGTTQDHIDKFIDALPQIIRSAREIRNS